MTYRELLKFATKMLETEELYSASAQFLMFGYLQQQNLDMYSCFDEEINAEFQDMYMLGIKRLSSNEPLGYILGFESFYGRDFSVDKRAFIPRSETEELVNEVLILLDEKATKLTGLDIGSGSGVIAITLALENKNITMWACDISEEALNLAKENTDKFKANINFVHSDLFENIPSDLKFDFIICNPPYIKEDELLESSVVDYEPHTALFAGKDGLDFYRRVFNEVKAYLNPHSFLAFEMGYDQAENLKQLAQSTFVDSEIVIIKDINGKDRMIFIFNNW